MEDKKQDKVAKEQGSKASKHELSGKEVTVKLGSTVYKVPGDVLIKYKVTE